MQEFVLEEWGQPNFVSGEQELDGDGKVAPQKRPGFEEKGKTGNVVPFFPTNWKKNANDVFNLIMNGQEATEDVYDEATHAAIHRKIED